jgi:hypothetical protein
MSNYTVQTNFGAKDGLSSGNAAKVIRGQEFTVEFDNIATAIGTKVDKSNAITLGLANSGSFTQAGTVSITGTTTFNGEVDVSGDVAVDTDTLFVDVSEDRVGINNPSPATALDVTGVITTDGLTTSAAIDVPDDVKINFGAGDKLKIYYEPDVGETFQKSRIQTSTDIGNILSIRSTLVKLTNVDDTANYLTALNGGSVNLFCNNNISLETNSYGVDITGTDGASVIAKVEADDAESANLKLKNTEGEFDIRCDGGTLDIYDVTDGASRLSFSTTGIATFGSDVDTAKVTNSGSLALNAGTGQYVKIGKEGNTNPHVVVAAETGHMGVGETVPDTRLHVKQNTGGTQIPIMTLENESSADAGAELQFLSAGSSNSTNCAKIRNKVNAIEFSENNRKTLQVGSGAPHTGTPSSRLSLYNEDTDSTFVQILSGTGSPEGVILAPQGSLYLRTDGGSGTTLYIKETSAGVNTGWDAK